MATTYALPADFDVVSRRVNQRSSSFQHVLHLLPLGVGQLRFDAPFTAITDDVEPGWHTAGRLYGRGMRFTRATRVDVELRAWSERACELRIRPASRRLPMWSKRRQRRYFDHAHHSADQLVRWLDAAVRRHDVTVAL